MIYAFSDKKKNGNNQRRICKYAAYSLNQTAAYAVQGVFKLHVINSGAYSETKLTRTRAQKYVFCDIKGCSIGTG